MSQSEGDRIWAALIADPSIKDIPAMQIIKPYILAMPEVLSTVMEKKVTLSTIMEAKIMFVRFLCDQKLATKQVNMIPEKLLGGKDRNQVAEQAEKALQIVAKLLENFAPKIQKILSLKGMTEASYFADPNGMYFRPEVYEKYSAGTLTIGQLLNLQPMIIVKNT